MQSITQYQAPEGKEWSVPWNLVSTVVESLRQLLSNLRLLQNETYSLLAAKTSHLFMIRTIPEKPSERPSRNFQAKINLLLREKRLPASKKLPRSSSPYMLFRSTTLIITIINTSWLMVVLRPVAHLLAASKLGWHRTLSSPVYYAQHSNEEPAG
jgi:hypothetical protein